MKKIILIAAALTIAVSAAAQPGGSRPEFPGPPGEKIQPDRLSVEQEAQLKVDQMVAELPLTQKQIDKLLKFYKKDIQYRRDNFEFAARGPRPDFGGERPSGPPPGGRPPQGGGPGGFPGGGPGGFPGGGPGSGGPGGGHGMGPQGGRPPMMGGFVDIEEIEKYNQKQEKKLRKILGDDLYNQWRSNHPLEAPKLPEIELQ